MTHHPPPHERTYDMSDETPERWLHHSEWSVQQHLAWAREGRRAETPEYVARRREVLVAAGLHARLVAALDERAARDGQPHRRHGHV
jgi:hypothetical protein